MTTTISVNKIVIEKPFKFIEKVYKYIIKV